MWVLIPVVYVSCGIAVAICHRIIAVRVGRYLLWLLGNGGISEQDARYWYQYCANPRWYVMCLMFPPILFQFLEWTSSSNYRKYRQEKLLEKKPDVFRLTAERVEMLKSFEAEGLKTLGDLDGYDYKK